MRLPFLPIAQGLHGSGAVVFGRAVYSKDTPAWVTWIHRAFKRVSDLKWGVFYRLHPGHRYHMVNTGLRPGYYDCDTLMLHACMALLCRYVEDEMGGLESLERFTTDLEREGDERVERQAERQHTAASIYRWWKHEKPADEKRRDELLLRLFGGGRTSLVDDPEHPGFREMVFKPFVGEEIGLHKEFRALEHKIDDDEECMMIALVKIRRSLWT